jgi:hypothetical protein
MQKKELSMNSNDDRQSWLRYSLLANAVFSTLSGLTFAIGAGAVASFIGVAEVALVRVAGLGLLGFAAYVAFVATRPEIDLKAALAIIVGDLSWVVGTVPIVLLDLLSTQGVVAAFVVADVVLLFAALQYIGVRRIRSAGLTPSARPA